MNRPIVKTIPVQPGLSVVIEDSHNILLEVTAPRVREPVGGGFIARTGAITNVAALVEALHFAREWVAIVEANAR